MDRGAGWKARLGGRPHLVIGAGVVIAGWLAILVINRWHVGPPVVFLCMAWLAVLLCGRALWGSAQAAAGEGTGPDEAGFELSVGRMAELEKEKRALLKAIKEVEFDREMGKMSEEDAAEISRVYRARAIDILKELEGDEAVVADRDVPIGREIEREVRARLALAGVAERKVKIAKAAAQTASDAPVAPLAATADAMPGAVDARPGAKKSKAKAAPAEAKPAAPAEAKPAAPAEAKPPAAPPGADADAAADDESDTDAIAGSDRESDPDGETGAGSKSAAGRSSGSGAAMQEREDA